MRQSLNLLDSDLRCLQYDRRLGSQTGRDTTGLSDSNQQDIDNQVQAELTAIEQATPTSAMQPPSAADIVAPRLNNMPMAGITGQRGHPKIRAPARRLPEAVKRKVIMLHTVNQPSGIYDLTMHSLSFRILRDELCDVFEGSWYNSSSAVCPTP